MAVREQLRCSELERDPPSANLQLGLAYVDPTEESPEIFAVSSLHRQHL